MKKHICLFRTRHEQTNAHHLNVNDLHTESFSLNDKIAHVVGQHVGTMWFCYAIATLMVFWSVLNLVLLPDMHLSPIDPAPFSLLFFFLGGVFQTLMLPLLMVAQNLDSRHAELSSEADYHVNQASFDKLAQLDTRIVQVLERIEALRQSATDGEKQS